MAMASSEKAGEVRAGAAAAAAAAAAGMPSTSFASIVVVGFSSLFLFPLPWSVSLLERGRHAAEGVPAASVGLSLSLSLSSCDERRGESERTR
jgi:hypothetical protein